MIVGIWTNPDKDAGFAVTRELQTLALSHGLDVRPLGDLRHWLGASAANTSHQQLMSSAQLKDVTQIAIIGGDGTLLSGARQMLENTDIGHEIPLFGINMGRVGFLSEIEVARIPWALERLVQGVYEQVEVMTLEILLPDGRVVCGVNDAVLTRGNRPRMIKISAHIGNQLVDRFPADGVIVSSPIGSTGYSLSAGGPILSQTMDCLLLTPVCPHALHARPFVLDAQSEICLTTEDVATLMIDGQQQYEISSNEAVKVRRSARKLPFVRFERRNFYDLLRGKMVEWTRLREDLREDTE